MMELKTEDGSFSTCCEGCLKKFSYKTRKNEGTEAYISYAAVTSDKHNAADGPCSTYCEGCSKRFRFKTRKYEGM